MITRVSSEYNARRRLLMEYKDSHSEYHLTMSKLIRVNP